MSVLSGGLATWSRPAVALDRLAMAEMALPIGCRSAASPDTSCCSVVTRLDSSPLREPIVCSTEFRLSITAPMTRDQVIGAVIDNLNSVLHTIGSRSGELSNLVTTLQQLVSGLAADRQPIGSAISAIASLSSATAGLLQVARPPLSTDITQLGRLAGNLAANTPTGNTFLKNLPVKMSEIAPLPSSAPGLYI